MSTVVSESSKQETLIKNPASLKNIEDMYDLSPLQLDNLEHYLKAPGEGIFHENLVFDFEGQIDVEIFTKCWEEIIKRHSILRTGFLYKGLKKPVQVVMRKVKLPLEILDWCNINKDNQEKKLELLTQKDREDPYILEDAPLMRLSLIMKSENQFTLWWRFHHMIMDGWAFTVVLFDFLSLYRNWIGVENKFPMFPGYPFKEYIKYRKNRNTEEEEAFWKEYLKNFVSQKPLTGLKAPLPGSVTTKTRQGRFDYPIHNLFQPLQQLVKANELTLNGVFQGIFTLLISYYSGGEKEIVTGQTVADRPLNLENSQSRVGLFVNTLPVRYEIQEKEKFVHWAKGFQTSMMNTFRFAVSSEQDIKKWCGIPEDKPIYHSALVFKNIPLSDDPFIGLPFRVTDYSLESRPHFPMSVFVWPDENLELKIIYDNKMYSSESAWEVLEKIKMALERLIENPNMSVSEMMNF